jgi:hypothetical protein
MWIEVVIAFAIGCVWVAAFASVIQVSRWIEKDINGDGGSVGRYRGWLILGFGFLGMCVWGPSLGVLLGSPELFVAIPIGLFPGLLVGYCVAKIVVPLFFTEPSDDLDQETEDATD